VNPAVSFISALLLAACGLAMLNQGLLLVEWLKRVRKFENTLRSRSHRETCQKGSHPSMLHAHPPDSPEALMPST
jgi:hypothetical protein